MPFVWRRFRWRMSSMSTRPTRKSALDALEKIRGVLAWESCSEKSEAFQAAAEQMEREFASAKRRRVALRAADSEAEDKSDCESDDDESEDDESSCESESDAGSARSTPSSADLYSDPGHSSDDEDSLSEAESSDVEVAVEPTADPAALLALSDAETELQSQDLV